MQSVPMAVSEYKHHSSKEQWKDRAGEEGHEDKHDAPRRQKPPPSQLGSWPPCLGDRGGPQARVQQHTVEQLAGVVPMVQILDIPVRQKVEKLSDFLKLLDTQRPVQQVTNVPKISQDIIQQRLVGRVCVIRGWWNS